MASDEKLTKVHVELPNNPAMGGESMWAVDLGGDLYELHCGVSFISVPRDIRHRSARVAYITSRDARWRAHAGGGRPNLLRRQGEGSAADPLGSIAY